MWIFYILTKGVIEILSSVIELGRLDILYEDEIGNGTCVDCLYLRHICVAQYSNIGVGAIVLSVQLVDQDQITR